jgi:hypothetical protein
VGEHWETIWRTICTIIWTTIGRTISVVEMALGICLVRNEMDNHMCEVEFQNGALDSRCCCNGNTRCIHVCSWSVCAV